jgi:hypothetical protein
MKNNSFILREEEKERIKKLYEQTTAAASGSYEQPMAFTEKAEEFELETVVDGGDNLEPGSVEINLDIEDIEDLLSVNEEERIRKMHRKNSTIQEQIDMPEVSVACLSCLRGALKGERVVNGIELGTYDYTPHAETIIGMIIKAKLGMEPTTQEIMEIMAKLRSTINVMDAPFIAANLMGECGVGGKTTLEVCMEDVDMDMTLGY